MVNRSNGFPRDDESDKANKPVRKNTRSVHPTVLILGETTGRRVECFSLEISLLLIIAFLL